MRQNLSATRATCTRSLGFVRGYDVTIRLEYEDVLVQGTFFSHVIAKLTYLTVVTMNKVQRIKDNAPSVVDATGFTPVRLRTVFSV